MKNRICSFIKKCSNRKASITGKFLILFFVASFIPLTIIEGANYYNTVNTIERKIKEYAGISITQTAKNIGTDLSGYEDLINQIAYDDNIIELIKQLDSNNRAAARNQLYNKLNIFSYSKKLINSVIIITEQGEYVISIDKTGQDINYKYWRSLGDITKTDIYKNSIEKLKLNVWDGSKLLGTYQKTSYYSFFLSRRLLNYITNTPMGVVVLSIDESALSDIYKSNIMNGGKDSNTSFIINNKGEIISHPNRDMIGQNVNSIFPMEDVNKLLHHSSEEFNSNIDNKDVMVFSEKIPKTEWQIVSAVDRNYLFREVYYTKKITLIVGVIALLIMTVVSTGISKGITRSVKMIIHAMMKAQNGELTANVKVKSNDEIGMIAEHFNLMIDRIKNLINEVKVAGQREKEAELKALEAQINPHFLYNTLDSINWMAIEKEEYEISNSIKQLAMILRYSINNSNQIVTLDQEFEWLKNYLSLQKNRFSDSFEYYINIEPDLLNCRIHKLLLQPFVENSIIHGVEGIRKVGVIQIDVKNVDEKFMMFIIKDNGKGMQQSDIDRIFFGEIKEKTGIGIQNVLSRLEMYYGDNYNLNVESVVGQGVTISVKIPKNREEDNLAENSCS